MEVTHVIDHLLNFLASALWVAAWVALLARVFMKKRAPALSLPKQVAINFVVSAAALAIGLWFFGHDGKMASYAAMLACCASSQWLMQRRTLT